VFLRHAGTTRRHEVVDDRDGGRAGHLLEHWSGRVDAHAVARSARVHVPEHGLLIPGMGLLAPPWVAGYRKGRAVPIVAGGAFANSGLYLVNWIDVVDATQLAIDLSLTTHKWAMYTNTLTPDFSANTSYAATNEVSGTGYTAGGRTIAAGGGSPTVTESPTGTLMYDQNDMVWTAPTSVTARGAIEYADALAGDNLIVAMTFGSDFTSTAGTFTIQFAATGVFTIDLTP
jgi:hypothetical protein